MVYGYGMRQRQRNAARRTAQRYRSVAARDAERIAARNAGLRVTLGRVGRTVGRAFGGANALYDAKLLYDTGKEGRDIFKKYLARKGVTSWMLGNQPKDGATVHSSKEKMPYNTRSRSKARIIARGGNLPTRRSLLPGLINRFGHKIPKGGNFGKFEKQGYRMLSARFAKTVKGKKKFTASVFKRKGVTVCEDIHTEVSGARTIYFGHYTHPHKAVIQSICHALAKYINLKCFKAQCASIEEQLGGESTQLYGAFRVTIFYRADNQAATISEDRGANIVGSSTVLQLSILLRDRIYAIIGNTANTQSAVIDGFKIVPADAGLNNFTPCSPLVMRAADMTFTVKGYSELKYQNSTLSANASASSDKHDVNANPVEGKIYLGKGSFFSLKRQDLDTNEHEGHLAVTARYGFGSFGSSDPTDAEVDRILEHPPTHRMWYGLSYSRSVRMQPGTMHKSVLKRVHRLKLNGWLRVYQRVMHGAMGTSSDSVSERTSVGVSRWFGVDKMIHDSNDPNTIMNCEVHVEVGCFMEHRRKTVVTATYPVIETSA